MSPHDILLPLFGVLTGLALGGLGSGGSILALPAFAYAAGLPVKQAIATSLAAVGITSFLGALLAQRRCERYGCPGQEVDPRIAAFFVGGSLLGAFTGARLSAFLPDAAQMLLFAVTILVAATGMARRALGPACAETFGRAPRANVFWLIPMIGLGVGLLTGIVGVGGGFLIVPSLTLLAGVPVKRAVSTSLWIISANAAVGVLGHLGHVAIAWDLVGIFLLTSLFGLALGQRAVCAACPKKLQITFAGFLILIGVFTVVKTLTEKSAAPIASRASQLPSTQAYSARP